MMTRLLTLIAIASFALGAGDLLQLQRDSPEIWRVFTSHLAHWNLQQLLWDGVVFFIAGSIAERWLPRAYRATLALSAVMIAAAIFLFQPSIASYRGLSGIDSAILALLLIHMREKRIALLFAVGFVGKILYEVATGSALFVTELGDGIVALPVAHLAGALAGALVGCTYRWLAGVTPSVFRSRSAPDGWLVAAR